MYGLLYHFKWFVVIVYYNVVSVDVCVKFSSSKAYRHYICIPSFDISERLGSKGN